MINKLVLGWSKIRRIFFVYFTPNLAEKKLERRHGECKRCGTCCELMFVCPALDRSNGSIQCKRYDKRSKVCKLFPLDENDLKDRNRVNVKQKCGFSFNGKH